MCKRFVPLLLVAALCQAAELPIRQVVLYKHGVGYFERSGTIPAGDSARLDFRASEMNDVLKSLIINGQLGSVAGLRYDSSVPLDLKLSEFPFRIDSGSPLSGVLDQLKGAHVEMQVGNEKVGGEIVAARVVAADKDRAERQQIVLLLASGEMRTFDLDAATSLRFTDARLQDQFREYLMALTAARSKDKRSVYIDSTGSGGRDITAGYIIPMPIWKSSYRLMFAETGEPTLEGWAIVDNTTGEDWTGVQMALVSGKPISFVSELYSPRYVRREQAELPEEAAMRPELHGGAISGLPAGVVGGVLGGVAGGSPGARFPMASQSVTVDSAAPALNDMGAQFIAKPPNKAGPSAIAAAANGAEIADLFEYRIAKPVTIKKNESAMLPFIQDKIKARKVILYTGENALHPLTAAELTNSTAKTLDGGPITVFDAGAYAGEALTETVKANDKRLISYGVDLGTRIASRMDSVEEQVIEIHVRRGVLTTKQSVVKKTGYSIHNVDAKAKTLILEHPLTNGFKVLNQTPNETTDSAFRFELKLAPSASRDFPVIEEQIQSFEQAVTNQNADTLIQYERNKALSPEGRRALEELAALKRALAENTDEAAHVKGRIQDISQDEERARRNLESLNRVSGQQESVQKYAAQLAQVETEIASLRDRESVLAKKNTGLSASIDDAIDKMNF